MRILITDLKCNETVPLSWLMPFVRIPLGGSWWLDMNFARADMLNSQHSEQGSNSCTVCQNQFLILFSSYTGTTVFTYRYIQNRECTVTVHYFTTSYGTGMVFSSNKNCNFILVKNAVDLIGFRRFSYNFYYLNKISTLAPI